MKRLIMIIALILLAAASLAALAQGQVTTFTSVVIGNVTNPVTPNAIALNGEAKESLPGVYHINIRYNPETKEISGGDWVRTVVQQEADGSQSELGTLHGNTTGGTVTLNEDGRVTAIIAATLAIAGGNRDYSGVTGGSGVFEGSIQLEGGAPVPQRALSPPSEGAQAPIAPTRFGPPDAGALPAFNGTMTLKF
jgi:hypothetical protein